MKILLDPGHGGKDKGASAGGLREKDITLEIGKKVRDELSKLEVEVELTRSTDIYLELGQE